MTQRSCFQAVELPENPAVGAQGIELESTYLGFACLMSLMVRYNVQNSKIVYIKMLFTILFTIRSHKFFFFLGLICISKFDPGPYLLFGMTSGLRLQTLWADCQSQECENLRLGGLRSIA